MRNIMSSLAANRRCAPAVTNYYLDVHVQSPDGLLACNSLSMLLVHPICCIVSLVVKWDIMQAPQLLLEIDVIHVAASQEFIVITVQLCFLCLSRLKATQQQMLK